MSEWLIKQGWTIRETIGFTAHIGPLWTLGEGTEAIYGLEVAEIHLNRRGHLHGGMLSTLADNSLAMAVAAAVPSRPIATVQLNIHFIGPATLGDFIEARCAVSKATRSLVFVRGRFTVRGKVIGEADGIWKTLDAPVQPTNPDFKDAEAEV